MDYYLKYFKYKNKYLNLKNQLAGTAGTGAGAGAGAGAGVGAPVRTHMENSSGLVLFNDKGEYRIVLVILNNQSCFNKTLNIRVPKVSTPGGIIDRGETPWTAFAREYNEEVGQDLPRLYRVGRYIPSYDDVPTKTRIFYSHLVDPKERIRYDITRVKNSETIGIIFPKLKHIKQMIDSAPRGDWIFIETDRRTYCIRGCVAMSLKRMFDSGLLDRYL